MPELRPITKDEAFAFIVEHHRHHDVPVGALWWQAVHDDDGSVCGVAITGRPVARRLDEGLSCEVTRLCTNGEDNACSMLYAAARRCADSRGYRRGITYILDSEYQRTDATSGKRIGGKSLEAAGYRYLVKGITPRSIRKKLGAVILDGASFAPAGNDAGPRKAASTSSKEGPAKDCDNWEGGYCEVCGAQWQGMEVGGDFKCPNFQRKQNRT